MAHHAGRHYKNLRHYAHFVKGEKLVLGADYIAYLNRRRGPLSWADYWRQKWRPVNHDGA